MNKKKKFKKGDKVVSYENEYLAGQLSYCNVAFHGVIRKIEDGIVTIQFNNGQLEYCTNPCRLRHADELMKHLRDLWWEFECTRFEDKNCIEQDFHIWKKGTDRLRILKWFDKQCPNGFGKDLIGTIEDYADGEPYDYCRCNDCEQRVIVPRAADVCPHCGSDGCMTDLWMPHDWAVFSGTSIKKCELPKGYVPNND